MRSFEMGQLVATRGIVDAVDNDPGLATFIGASLGRYQRCDWGEMCQEDKDMNDLSLSGGGRIFAAYENEVYKVWIITEADRSVTTVLFPDEY